MTTVCKKLQAFQFGGLDYESEGRTFESFRARHFRNLNKIEFALSNAPSRGRSRGKLLGTRERGGNAGIIRVTRQGAGLPRTSPRMRTSYRALGIPQGGKRRTLDQ